MSVVTRPGSEVPLATKLAYSVGALSETLRTFSFGLFLLFFYTTVMGLPGTLVGVAMSVGLLWDAGVDPLIGTVSDRARFGFGRRHSFMLVGAVCGGLSFFAVFNPPGALPVWGLFAWLMGCSLAVRTSNSLFMVPYYALGAELTDDYHERTSLAGYRAAAVHAGTLLAAAVAFLVLFRTTTPGPDAKFTPGAYGSVGLAFGIAISVAGLIATFGTLRERAWLTGTPINEGSARPSAVARIVEPLRSPSFRVLLLSSSLFLMGATINAALSMHFLTYQAGIGTAEAFAFFFAAFYVGALAGVVVWVRVTRRVEKHKVCAAAMMTLAVVMCAAYGLIGEGRPFGVGNVWLAVLINGVGGVFGSAIWVVAPSMMADITAFDELETGRRRDGAFFGLYSFGQQLAAGLAVLVAGVLVDRFAGLVAGQPEQSRQTAERLAMLFALVPALVLVSAAVIVLRYKLTRRHVEQAQVIYRGVAAPASGSGLSA